MAALGWSKNLGFTPADLLALCGRCARGFGREDLSLLATFRGPEGPLFHPLAYLRVTVPRYRIDGLLVPSEWHR